MLHVVAVGTPDAVAAAVDARYAAGPFVPADGASALRTVELAGADVREHHTGKASTYLAHWLADTTHEPVMAQTDDYRVIIHPDDLDRDGGGVRDVEPLGAWHPTTTRSYALDLQRQRELEQTFERDVLGVVKALFPIQNRARTARLDCKKVAAYGPSESYRRGIFRYDRSLQSDVQLALVDRSGDELTVRELRTESVIFARYQLLTPTGGIVHRGVETIVPFDEYADNFTASLRRFKRELRRRMDELASWAGVTPKQLIDPES
jgi:hypothetical protein